jgi:hypothetical protein
MMSLWSSLALRWAIKTCATFKDFSASSLPIIRCPWTILLRRFANSINSCQNDCFGRKAASSTCSIGHGHASGKVTNGRAVSSAASQALDLLRQVFQVGGVPLLGPQRRGLGLRPAMEIGVMVAYRLTSGGVSPALIAISAAWGSCCNAICACGLTRKACQTWRRKRELGFPMSLRTAPAVARRARGSAPKMPPLAYMWATGRQSRPVGLPPG